MRWLAALAVLALAPCAQARVFSYKDANMAAYLRGTGGLSALGKTAFEDSIGTGNTVDGSTKYDYSGEIGFMYTMSGLSVRLGAELIQHRPVSEGKGLDAGGTELFLMDSSVSAFNPNITFEYAFQVDGNQRYYAMAGAGMADVTVENKFTMTAAGTTATGLSDYNELLTGSATSLHAGVGMETLFTDNVTFHIDVGYRHLPVTSLKYKGDANTLQVPTGVAKGDPAYKTDGSKRTLNLGGLVVGLGFRFWLSFI